MEISYVLYARALMTQKSCAVGMRNAKLGNHLTEAQAERPCQSPLGVKFKFSDEHPLFSDSIKGTVCRPRTLPARFKVFRPWQTRTHCCRHKCFPVCPRAQNLLRTQIGSATQKMYLILFRNICCVRNKCFPVCAAQETSWATMCPRLPGPFVMSQQQNLHQTSMTEDFVKLCFKDKPSEDSEHFALLLLSLGC